MQLTLSTAVRAGNKTIRVYIFFLIPKILISSINFAIVGLALFLSITLLSHLSIINLGVKGPNVGGDVIKKTGDAAIEQVGLQLGNKLLDEAQHDKILVTSLHEVYPKLISTLPMDFGTTDDILRVTATFTYRFYTQEFLANKPKELSAIDRNWKFLAKNLKEKYGRAGIPLDNGLIQNIL